ncbi:hypothetical protein B0J15DRAFT_479737 [Fusarium solani]|uniref:Uncharacterized protein n=1 Tax=Fusarium solani TaxID=169388 RepID=A0A9P9L452_FUSSL|nr:uncharacterized protein B0J15DRAFT_479737 [Fusarium solani]KAH7274425.1 hypothetical protein B0J15DRAFT_479737 [Fusarium solani]
MWALPAAAKVQAQAHAWIPWRPWRLGSHGCIRMVVFLSSLAPLFCVSPVVLYVAGDGRPHHVLPLLGLAWPTPHSLFRAQSSTLEVH